jgi:purine-binding chemotaxis protein CheW
MKQYATFKLGESLFGVNIILIREIIRNMEITPAALVAEYVHGLINLRGQIVTVLDLKKRLKISAPEDDVEAGIIILKTSGEIASKNNDLRPGENTVSDMVGFLADEIGDMVTLEEKNIEAPPANISGIEGRYIDGIAKLEEDLLIILKIAEILKME